VLTVWSKPPQFTVAHIPPVNTVTHPPVQTSVVPTRAVHFTVVPVEPRLTPALVLHVGPVAAVPVVLTGGGRARVIARTVTPIEPVVAETVVIRVAHRGWHPSASTRTVTHRRRWSNGGNVTTESIILTGGEEETSVEMLAVLTVVTPRAGTLHSLRDVTGVT